MWRHRHAVNERLLLSDSEEDLWVGCRPVGASVGPIPGEWDCDPYLSEEDEAVVDKVDAALSLAALCGEGVW